MKIDRRSLRRRTYQVAVCFKGLDGVLEVCVGLTLLVVRLGSIQRLVGFLTRSELIEDPDDFFANLAVKKAAELSASSQHFAAVYMLAHGAVKLVLAVGLLRKARWSYPVALPVLGGLIVYQCVRYYRTRSAMLLCFTLIDVAIVWLVWLEWAQARRGARARRHP